MAGLRPAFTLPRFEVVSAAVREKVNWGHELLGVPQLWEITRGEGVVVGVVDSGIATRHPELTAALAESKDFTGSAAGVADELGHGTHVAGIIAAAQDGRGVVGVAPRCRLLNAKVVSGRDDTIPAVRVAEAVTWCFDRGADLVNLSLGSSEPAPALLAVIRAALERPVPGFVICAAGNSGGAVDFPARYDETVAVGSVQPAPGGIFPAPDSARGTQVDLVAPGGAICSTYPPDLFARASGTSMAAPFVTGVAALLIACRRAKQLPPPASVTELIALLTADCTDLYLKGRDQLTGMGLINPAQVLAAAAKAPGDSG